MYKPHVWKKSLSGVIAGKALNHIAGLCDQTYFWMDSIDLIDRLYFNRLPEKENI